MLINNTLLQKKAPTVIETIRNFLTKQALRELTLKYNHKILKMSLTEINTPPIESK